MSRISDLMQTLGPAGTSAAAAFVAYLVGSILTIRAMPPPRDVLFDDGMPRTGIVPDFVMTWADRQVDHRVRGGGEHHLASRTYFASRRAPEIGVFLSLFGEGDLKTGVKNKMVLREALQVALYVGLREEFDALATRIQIERPALYEDYARLRSEWQLRFSIAPPLLLLAGTLCMMSSWLWALGLGIPVVLVIEGRRTLKQSQRLVWQALTHGVIASTSVESLDQPNVHPGQRLHADPGPKHSDQ